MKDKQANIKDILNRIIYFFPFQLLLLHFKRNHLLLIFWMLLFFYVTGVMGSSYGVSSLFLAPEYNGEINFYSFAIVGFAMGGFIMAFHIYSYIMFSSEFIFLATLTRPFLKFCINNMLIPIAFVVTLLVEIYMFLSSEQLLSDYQILINISAIIIGALFFYLLSVLYFIRFNKNVFVISGKTQDYFDKILLIDEDQESYFIKKKNLSEKLKNKSNWRIDSYMSNIFKLKLARRTSHYKRELLDKVFSQNHINASVFEIALIVTFIVLGIFREFPILNIPAGASIFLLFTFFVLIFSAFYSWFRAWTITILIALILSFNYISITYNVFKFHNYAYGLDYSNKADYSYKELLCEMNNVEQEDISVKHGIKMLENWKLKNHKSKMIFLNVSGGGLRSSLWTVNILNYLDSITENKFFDQTQLITGASGGMIGAAYYRDLILRKKQDSTFNISSQEMKKNISKDLLNQLAFSIATTDMLIRFQKYYDGNYSYTKDRGWFFEKTLVNNLDAFHDSRLIDYYLPEFTSKIPMMIFSPGVVNDGRRVLISSQPISYMTHKDSTICSSNYPSVEDIEFNELFANNDSYNVKMTSVLRMNATFPYILPMVSLPTNPPIEVMDAGMRDNFGFKTSINFIKNFNSWIEKNSSGIIIVQIRDKQKFFEINNPNSGTLMTRLFSPLTNIYGNLFKVHDYQNDEILNSVSDWYKGEVDVVTFYMDQSNDEKISMSWHLTNKDKRRIYKSIESDDNQLAIDKIYKLINNEKK